MFDWPVKTYVCLSLCSSWCALYRNKMELSLIKVKEVFFKFYQYIIAYIMKRNRST